MANYSDDFNRANGAIGSDYTVMTGLTIPVVTSNQAACGALSSHAARVTALSFGSNQKSSIRMKTCNTSCGIMAGVRFQSAAMNGYAIQFAGSFGASQAWQLKRITANVATVLASGTASTATNDVISITAVGSIITAYLNGAIIAQVKDATYTGGAPGFYMFVSGSTTNVAADDFSCTDEGFVSDDFTRADNTDLGANWTVQFGYSDFRITSNKAVPTNYNNDCGSLYDTALWSNDQWAEIEVGALASPGVVNAGIGIILRGSLGVGTLYRAYGSLAANSVQIRKRIAGVGTPLITLTGAGLAAGDILRFDATGTTLTLYKNGTQILQTTDPDITGGYPGVHYSSTDSGAATDSIAQFTAFGASPIPSASNPDYAGVIARVVRNL